MLVAIVVDGEGYRKILGIAEGGKEDKKGWDRFLSYLKNRGLKGVQLVTSDAYSGLIESISEYYPDSRWQRCCVHFYRNVLSSTPKSKMREVCAMLKAIHAQEDRTVAQKKQKTS